MSQTQPSGVEGNAFLFREPQLLTKEVHGSKGVARPDRPFQFCEHVRAVPITVSEIASAMKHYPVIFSAEDNPLPMAVVGIIDERNLFVDDSGEWETGAYIPGYIRRYPFALAGDNNSDRMAIIVDGAYEGITAKPDTPFFEGDKPSEAMNQAMEFCKSYEQETLMTREFGKRLAAMGVVKSQVAQYTPQGGEAQPFAQYFGVDEKLLNELPEDKFLELRKTNMLPILYAQLMSMGNWRMMMDRRVRRFNIAPENVLKPLPVS